MASVFSKSCLVGFGFSFLVACGGESPGDGSGAAAGSNAGGALSGGSSGAGGSVASAGTATGGGGGSSGGAAAGAAAGGASGGGGGQTGGSGGNAGASGGGTSGGSGGMAGAGGMAAAFVLTSPAFEHVEDCSAQNHAPCKIFPNTNVMMTIGGDNISPELSWGPGPTGTMSYVITLHDFSNNFTHWAIWNISAATLKLPANLARQAMPAVPAGSQQKSFNKNDAGYMGPGAKDHIYEFRLYALKVGTFTPKDATDQGKIYDELEADADKIVLGKSMLRGRSPS